MDALGRSTHRFTINQRIAIIEEYELAEIGQRGAVLRRHGIANSTISRWRKQQREGLLEPSEHKESRTRLTRKERADYLRVQKETNAQLRARLAQAESTVEVLGKASALLESLARSAAPEPEPAPEPDPPAWGERYMR